jgi:amino acid adenylation domain-containing protein
VNPVQPPQAALTNVGHDPLGARVILSTERQREVWLTAKSGTEALLACNESITLRLRGTLDRGALNGALQDLVDRHDALRASFSADGETFRVRERNGIDLPLEDLSRLEIAERDVAVAAHVQLAVKTPFVLEHDSLFRAELLRCASDDHMLSLSAHPSICDLWSWRIIVRELAILYAARRGVPTEPLAPAASFADYAFAQAAHSDLRRFAADEAYWLARFADAVPVLELPLDRPRPPRHTFASAREDYVFDGALVAAINRLGAQCDVSLFAILLGSFAALLARLAGQAEAVIGIPAAAQSLDGHENLVGHCVNILPLRCAADPAASFTQFLDTVRVILLDALEHQRYAFGTLLKKLDIGLDPSRLPLVNVVFNLDQALDHKATGFPDATMELASSVLGFGNFELFINAVQEHGQLRLECQYNRDLFDAVSVRRWLGAYEILLRSAIERPQALLGELSLVDEVGRSDLAALQPPRTPFDPQQRAHEFFEAQCDRAPERIAVRAGVVTLSYAELETRANRVAHLLRAHGVHRGALVGIAVDRDVDMVAAVLGVLKAGAGYVPLDPGFPMERLNYVVDDADLAALITQSEYAARFDLGGRPVLALDRLGAQLEAMPATRIGRDADAATADSVVYVIYTSGSTGLPKGVLVPHRATANFLTGMQCAPGIGIDDRLVSVTTLSFDIAFVELMLPLAVGAQVIVASREQARDGTALRALIERSDANYLQAAPAGWRLLLESGWQGHARFRAVSGGEPLSLAVAEALLARCGEVWNGYGPTECTIYATFWKVENPHAGIVIGRPIANTTVWILDEQRQLCPIGVPGEIWIGGEGVALGYLNRPELTAERFVADPYADTSDARLYRTGDRGRWLANGTIEHLGRIDFQIKLRGYRIEPGEIEAHLVSQPEIAHAVVTVREDRPGDARLLAYLVAAVDTAVDETAVRARLREVLPDYMIPQHFIVLGAIPLLPNGKIDRGRLPAPAELAGGAGTRVAPRDELERRVATAMAAALGGGELGVDDNFFEHGGHSLLAAQVTTRLNRELDIGLSLAAVFQTPTPARLAEIIRGLVGTSLSPALPAIQPLRDRRRAPLSILQQRLAYLEQLRRGSVVYNTPSAYRLHGRLDEKAFERTLQEVVRRQAVLRTSIDNENSEPQQRIHDDVMVNLLPVADLSNVPTDERDAELGRCLERLIDEPFDLARAPLFRARLFRLEPEQHVFLFVAHHIVWDGWSFELLYAEMSAIYTALSRGESMPLPPLAIQYGDFAAWHREWMRGDALAHRLGYWKNHLRGALEPLDLPTDHPRPTRMSGAGATEWMLLPDEFADAIRKLGQSVEATSFMVLFAVYYVFLHRHSGQRDLVVGTPVRGRELPELEPVMGYFANVLPLRMVVDPNASFLDCLRQLRSIVIDALAYSEVPFDQLMTELKIPRDASRPPLYQAMFGFQDVRQRRSSWGDLRHEHLPVFQRGAADDLGLWFIEQEQGLLGGLTYNTDIFDASTGVRFCERYEVLLASVLADPQRPISRLALLPASEHDRLRHWNATAAGIPDQCIHALIEAQCERVPQRIALHCDEQTLTYAELEARANRLAHALRARGARRGALVGIALDRGIDMVATVLGALKTGAGYVPLDPAFPRERLAFMVDDAGLAVLVTERKLADRFDVGNRPVLLLDDPSAALDAEPITPLAADADMATAESIAYVIYTSGSTGQPKGVEIPHRAVANFIASMARRPGLSEDDRLVAVTTLSFDIAVLELFGPLSVGAEVVLARREDALDGEALKALLASSRATLMQATPATWRVLLRADWPGSYGFRALCGGEALPRDLAAQLLACCGEVWNLYGPTETTVWSTCWRVVHPEQGISIGTPIANTTVWILDEQRQLCPIGVPGEIWIGGAGVALGYLDRPDLTAERFVADPYSDLPDARLYRSGDRGLWRANGTLEHLGRLDFQVKLRGFRIEPGEIETVARAEPVISDCVVDVCDFSVQDRRLVLYVVSAESEGTLLPRLRMRLSTSLPGYMQPQHVVVLAALPHTPNGKIDRNALPAPLLKPVSAGAAKSPAAAPLADPRQRYLAAIWCELIGVSEVDPHDNFFDIGGYSLLAVELATRVRRETGARLNLLQIATGTLGSLAVELPEREPRPNRRTLGQRVRNLFGLGKPDQAPE